MPIGLFFFVGGFLVFTSGWVEAFDWRTEGRFTGQSAYILDAPNGFSDFDHELELRLGVLGNVWGNEDTQVDYELTGDVSYIDGPREESGFQDEVDADFFRAWLRLERGNFKLRGGRQKILFGAGMLFRPLGFFDTRDIAGIIPETRGVDGVRATYFTSDTSSLEGWLVPAKLGSRLVVGGRGEWLIGEIEAGIAAQYHPSTDLDDLRDFQREMVQVGAHFKGENVVGYWNESRLDIEQTRQGQPLRFDTTVGVDYTFGLGQGLHVVVEYFLTTWEREFSLRDSKGDRTLHQLGLELDQPVGIDIVWRFFAFYDILDRSFQVAPHIEYSLNEQVYLFLLAKIGGSINGDDRTGRLFRDLPVFTGTESFVGISLVAYF